MKKLLTLINEFVAFLVISIFVLPVIFVFSNYYLDNFTVFVSFAGLNKLNNLLITNVNFYIEYFPLEINKYLGSLVNNLRNIEVATGFVKYAILINLVAGSLITLKSIADTLGALVLFSNNQALSTRVFFPFKLFFSGGNKEKPWGVVYDAVTKQPVDPALVTISTLDSRLANIKQTRVTDSEGRFSFLVGAGRYVIDVQKTNYSFPSKVVSGKTDGKYEDIYHGEVIEVVNPNIININIPLDPVSFDWNQSIKPKANLIIEFFKDHGRSMLLSSGIGLSLVTYVTVPIGLNLALILVYLFNLLFWESYTQKRLWGMVRSKLTGEVVQAVGVRAIRKPYNISFGYTTTDYLGRYFLLLRQGSYTIQVETVVGRGQTPQILAKIDNIVVTKKKEIISFDIGV